MDKKNLYEKTGIQLLKFNTIYQLFIMGKTNPEYLKKARKLLFITDYLNYLFSGKKENEYTVATTSAMLNAKSCDWDSEILDQLNIKHLFKNKPIKTGAMLGQLHDSLKKELDIKQLNIIATASHDTACAVISVPHIQDDDDWAYISSGTWSLLGIETDKPIISEKSLKYNITNEGGYNNTIRVLKNMMGMWIMQNIKKEYDDKYSFDDLENMARDNDNFHSLIDPSSNLFFNPKSMLNAIRDYCKATNQQLPEKAGDYSRCAYHSLANLYDKILNEIEYISEKQINTIYIVGGGSQDKYLNQLTSDYTKKIVFAGPVEATAIGNIVVQLISQNIVSDIKTARKMIFNSFEIKKYNPQNI